MSEAQRNGDGPTPDERSVARLRRVVAVAVLAVVLLVGTLGGLGMLALDQLGRIEATWQRYHETPEQKGLYLSRIRAAFGYGGLIHNFKNLVLRGDETRLPRIERDLAELEAALDGYAEAGLSAREAEALQAIRATVTEYESKVAVAREKVAQGWAPEAIDNLVKVDDSAAVAGLRQLAEVWRETRQKGAARQTAVLGEAHRIVEVTLAVVPLFLLLAVLVIWALRRLFRETMERSHRYRSILDNVFDAVITIDERGLVQSFNTAAERIFGYRAEEVIGRNVSMLMPGDRAAEHDGYIARYLETGVPGIIGSAREVTARRKDGEQFPVDLSVTETRLPSGRLFTGVVRDLSEKKAAEEQLRNLSQATEHSPAVVIITDAEGRIEYVNPRFTEVSGYTAEEVLGETPKMVSSGQMDRETYAEMWDTLRAGRIWQGEFENRRKDGSLYWVHASISPIRDADGRIRHFVGVQEDITEQKRVAEALRASEERFQSALDFAAIGAWDWNVQTGELHWSKQISPLFGYPEGALETSYENFIAAVHPDDRDLVREAVRRCVEEGVDYDVEHRVVWPDGQVRWLLERGDVVRDPDGEPVRMLGVVQDITERKQAEAALRESEERLSNAIENISEGFALFDADDRLVLCNTRFRQLYDRVADLVEPGVAFERMLQAGIDRDLFPEAADHPGGWLAERLDRRRRQRVSFEEKLAGDRWIRVTDQLLPNGGRVCIRVDVTELTEARQQAEAANKAKSEFLSSMSHELRTPLNAILGFAQILESSDRHPLTERQKGQVRHILKAGQHLLELINEVLDLARIEAGRLALSIEDIEPRGLVDEALTLVQSLAEKYDVTLEDTTAGQAMPTLRGDYTRTKQVLLNLLSNAVKYNRPGGRVRLDATPTEDGYLRLSVADTGAGIAADRLAELFQPFSRLGAEATEIEGTGIGLTLTKELVEQMDGRIDVDSTPGEGSTFWIDMPLSAADAAGADPGGNGGRESRPLGIDGAEVTRTLLYVEDNPANMRLMEAVVAEIPDLDLITVPNAELGLAYARGRQPDVIVLDLNLPGLGGLDLARRLRDDAATRDIPLIALTAEAMTGTETRTLEAGFRTHLTKPVDIARLSRALKKALAADP